MQRLTLILSDLYLPEGADSGAPPRALDLPALDWLLRFAEVRRIRDWRHWLAADLGIDDAAAQSIARTAARAIPAFDAAHPWLATPVRLEARLDHVRLVDRGLLQVDAAEAAAWCEDFGRTVGPKYSLHALTERAFLLAGMAAGAVNTVDPARVLDADIGASLPRGAEATELRRLGAEIEMWLHAAPLNEAREKARLPRISTLWLWGGGEDVARVPMPGSSHSRETHGTPRIFGSDPFLAGISSALAPAPEGYAALGGGTHAIVELAAMSGPPQQSLHRLEAGWFNAVRSALGDGSLAICDILANDGWFRLRARPGWKIWKRRRSWLEQVGRL